MGTGFNYIREIMQMNLPEESTPKPLREYEKEAKKFHYIGLTPYMPYDNNCTVKLMPEGMAGVIACNKDELTTYKASVLDVVQHCGRLYTYTPRGHWAPFVPGPCTDYDGPNPYEKTIYAGTSATYDSPIAEAIRENLKKSLDMAGVIGLCEIERVSDTEIVAKYDIKYLGETETDVKRAPNKRAVWLEHPFRTYNRVRHEANIGEAVKWDGQIYVWNGNQWVESPKQEKLAMEWPKTNKEEKNMAFNIRYLGESELRIYEGSTNGTVKIDGKHGIAKSGDIIMSDGELYAFAPTPDDKRLAWRHIKTITLGDGGPVFCYNKVKPNWLAIDKVVFNAPATIVFWKDGTKTIVKCGDNEPFDPEKGLTMAIAKKVFGNQGNYYNQIKKWLPKKDETIEQVMERDPAQEYTDSTRDLITDMALNGATKAELVRAIRFSKELIDGFKATPSEKPDFNPFKLEKDYGITALREKYQKSKKTK